MYFLRLYSKPFENINEIKEVSQDSYVPIRTEMLDIVGKNVSFVITKDCTVCGAYITSEQGDLPWHQEFGTYDLKAGSQLSIQFPAH